MPVALTTINAAKEQSSTYQPILLADFLFCDGSKLHLSTHPLNAVEGGFPLPGAPATDYKARLASHNIQEIQSLSQQGISLIPSITLAIEDPDAAIYTANETTIGFRGAVVTLTLVLWDVGANTFSSDARTIFAGLCEKAVINATTLSVTAVSEVGKKVLPTVVHQAYCVWPNPTTLAQRATANNPDSQFYWCGEDRAPDVAPPCQHTTATCTRPLRRLNITWDPVGQQFVTAYGAKSSTLITNTLSSAVMGQPVPVVYGTGWINAKPIATVGDGNYTRFETIAALGPLSYVLNFVVNGEQLSPANNPDGSSSGVPNKDFRYNWINNGRRDGSPNLDSPWSGHGDPYGGVAAFLAVVPKDVAAPNSPPTCQILAAGGATNKFQQVASISVVSHVATLTVVGLNWDIGPVGAFNFTISGSTFAAINGTYGAITGRTSGPPGTITFACPGVADGSGTGGYIRYAAYTENPVWIYIDIRVRTGDSYAQYNLATACAAAAICDQQLNVRGMTSVAYLAVNPTDLYIDALTTDGCPSPGILLIDSEQISYSGTRVYYDGIRYIPQFVVASGGRGFNSTVAATHAIGAPITGLTGTVSRARYSTNLVVDAARSVADILRGIQAAANLIVNRNTSTGQYETYIEDTLPDSQSALVVGSNYSTPVSGLDKNGNIASGYAAYRFDELTDILAGPNGGSTLEELQRGINDFPNKLQVTFADAAFTYARSSISVDAMDDVYRLGQEIPGSPTNMPEGMTTYDQALCQLRLLLAKSLLGNEAGDGRGTRAFSFQTTFKGVHLRVGHLVLLNSVRLGLNNRVCRVTAIQPTTNWEDAKITVSWHEDKWYGLGYGRAVSQDSTNRRIAQSARTPLQWTANQDAAASDAVLPTGYKTFGLGTVYTSNADGSKSVRISATGELIVNQFSALAQAPLVVSPAATSATGGTVPGGQSYYLALAAKDAVGLLSPLSNVVRVDIPAGTATNTATLTVTSWPGTVSGYCLFAGQTAQRLTLQSEASGTPGSVVLSAFTPYGESAPEPGFDHLEADVALCFHNGVAVGQASATATTGTVTFTGTPFTGLALTGRIASVVASDADTRVRNFLISGNTSSSLTFATTPDIQINDWVCVRSLLTVAGLVVSDPLWNFTPGALVGKTLRTIAGNGTPQTQSITANTGGLGTSSITVGNAWTYAIDSTSLVLVEEPSVLLTVRTVRQPISARHTGATLGVDLKNYPGKFVRISCYAADGRNARAAEALALTRDLYIAGASGALSVAGVPSQITSFGMSYEIEGTSAVESLPEQGGGVWTWSGSAWVRTGPSAHAIGDAHTGVQSVQAKFVVGVPLDPNTAGIWIVHSCYPDSTYTTPIPSTESGWFGNGWGIVVTAQPPQGAPFTAYGSWNALGSWTDRTGLKDWEAFTAWTYNRNPNPDSNAPPMASPLVLKVGYPQGFRATGVGSGNPLLPTSTTVVQTIEGLTTGADAIGTAAANQQSVTYKFSGTLPADSNRAGLSAIFSVWTDKTFTTMIPGKGSGWFASGPTAGWGIFSTSGASTGPGTFQFIAPTESLGARLYLAFTVIPFNGSNAYPTMPALPSRTVPFGAGSYSAATVLVQGPGNAWLMAATGAPFSAYMVGKTYLLNGAPVVITAYVSTTQVNIASASNGQLSLGLPDSAILQDAGPVTLLVIPVAGPSVSTGALVAGGVIQLIDKIVGLSVVPVGNLSPGTVNLASATKFADSVGGQYVLIDGGMITIANSNASLPIAQFQTGGIILQDKQTAPQYAVKITPSWVKVENTVTGPGMAITATGATIAQGWSGVAPLYPNVAIGSSTVTISASVTANVSISASGGGASVGLTDGTYSGFLATQWGGGFQHGLAIVNSTGVGSTALCSDNGVIAAASVYASPGGTLEIHGTIINFVDAPKFSATQPTNGAVSGTLTNFPTGTTSGNPRAFVKVILADGTHAVVPAWALAW